MSFPIFNRYLVDETGTRLINASVTVTNERDGLPAVFYSDRAGLFQVPNPFLTGETGECTFFIAAGEYRIQATSGSTSIDLRYVLVAANNLSVSSILTTSTTLNSTSPKNILCSGAAGGFTITLPPVDAAAGVEFTITRTDLNITNIITISVDTFLEAIDTYTTLPLISRNSVLSIISNGFNWVIKEYYTRGRFVPSLIGTTVPGSHVYAAANGGSFTRTKNTLFLNGSLSVTTKDAAMLGNVRIGGLPYAYANDGVDTIDLACMTVSSFSNINTAGDTQVGGALSLGNNYIELRESADNLTFSNITAAQVSSGFVINFSATYTV